MKYAFLLQTETIEQAAEATGTARDAFIKMFDGFWTQLPYIAVGLIVFLLFLVIASFVSRASRMGVEAAGFDTMIASLIGRISYFATTIIGFFIAAVVIFPGLTPGDLIAGLGIGSVALGFAFKDILQNLFAGFLILLYRPFKINDQIKIKDFEGTVDEISIRATKIRTYDNELVVIPNSELYMNAVLVRTAYPSRRTSFVVGIGYDDDIEEARKVLFDVVGQNEEILKDPAPTVDVVELADSSVNLKIQFWTDSVKSSVRKASDELVTKIKYALDEKGIDMPYPTHVLLNKNL